MISAAGRLNRATSVHAVHVALDTGMNFDDVPCSQLQFDVVLTLDDRLGSL